MFFNNMSIEKVQGFDYPDASAKEYLFVFDDLEYSEYFHRFLARKAGISYKNNQTFILNDVFVIVFSNTQMLIGDGLIRG